MRAGLSTVQQTLTPDAAAILNQSISEACRRNHGQTTPLHVAATLLSSPSGFLRQACIRSHPNSSHPLQCRALELCFSVALERLPSAQSMSPGMEPPISNALMAALKRAQAHQRRGCPEQQQQPLLAVKVELDQLIISILDDPSVSRVMREASFSSPSVKAAIEQSVNSSNSGPNVNFGPRMLPNSGPLTAPYGATCKSQVLAPLMQTPSPVNRNLYMNPRLQPGPPGPRSDEVKRVYEIMSGSNKRNPILVGDSEAEAVARDFLRKVENKELGNEGIFKNVQIISMEKGAKIKEMGEMIESRIGSGGVILDLGDLRWLVEHQQSPAEVESAWTAVVEMSRLLARFSGNEENKVWLIGTATCETYLRCQIYHSTMENDWALHAVSMAPRLPLSGIFQRHLSDPMEPLSPIRAVPTRRALENFDPCEKTAFCPQCSNNYEKELGKLMAIQKSFSGAPLPQWLQNAKLNTSDDPSQGKDSGLLSKQKTQELQRKWREVCLHLHPHFHQNNRADRQGPPTLLMTGLYSQNKLARPVFQPKLQTAKPLGEVLQLNTERATSQPGPISPPGSPVRTDLVLGRKGTESTAQKDVNNRAKDFLGCISSAKLLDKFSNALDADRYKKLLNGLMQKCWWQAEAASMVATAITHGEHQGGGSRGDTWLLFAGPDRVGKKKMATVIAEQICGARPIMICLGTRRDDDELDMNFRGKTVIDRIAEAVRRNPSSVIMLQDIDESDMLVRGSIKRAMERGRIADSHGREVSLGNTIFVLTGDWSRTNPNGSEDGVFVEEKKLALVASGNWQLGLIVREKTNKRRASWSTDDDDRPLKPRKELASGLSLDLNLGTCKPADDQADGSYNTSDLTVDHEDEFSHADQHFSVTSVPQDMLNDVDDCIVFKPVDATFVRQEIKKTISLKFSTMVDENVTLEVEDDVLERILGGLWHDRTSLEEWVVKVLEPSFDRLKPQLRSGLLVRLVVESDSGSDGGRNGSGDWLPSSILV